MDQITQLRDRIFFLFETSKTSLPCLYVEDAQNNQVFFLLTASKGHRKKICREPRTPEFSLEYKCFSRKMLVRQTQVYYKTSRKKVRVL